MSISLFFWCRLLVLPLHQAIASGLIADVTTSVLFIQLHGLLHGTRRKLSHFIQCFLLALLPQFGVIANRFLSHKIAKNIVYNMIFHIRSIVLL